MKTKIWLTLVWGFSLTLLMAGCSMEITRNGDGSLQVESELTEAGAQSEIARALADSQFSDLTSTLEDGYIFVSGERMRVQDPDTVDSLTFKVTLSVSDGRLAAQIVDPTINGQPMDPERTENWNERIADRLEKFGQRRPNATLEAVSVTDAAILMTWNLARP